jgi:hypothetical protein
MSKSQFECFTFFVRQAVFGFCVALVIMLGILLTDFSHLGSLMAMTEHGWLAAVVLTVMLGSTFVSVQIGITLSSEAEPPQDF